jgi:hypothetical protein
MIRQGEAREQIMYALTSANWPYDDAANLVKKIASSERWKAAGAMTGGAVLVIGFGALSFFAITNPRGGMIWYGPIFFGIVLFIYGLVRLAKMRI